LLQRIGESGSVGTDVTTNKLETRIAQEVGDHDQITVVKAAQMKQLYTTGVDGTS